MINGNAGEKGEEGGGVNEMERINEARTNVRTCADRLRPPRGNWEIAHVRGAHDESQINTEYIAN